MSKYDLRKNSVAMSLLHKLKIPVWMDVDYFV